MAAVQTISIFPFSCLSFRSSTPTFSYLASQEDDVRCDETSQNPGDDHPSCYKPQLRPFLSIR